MRWAALARCGGGVFAHRRVLCVETLLPPSGNSVTATRFSGEVTLSTPRLLTPRARAPLPRTGDLFGHRIVGSANLETSIDWVVDRLNADGFQNVHKEPATVKVWQRGEESCTLTAPLVGDQASYDVAILVSAQANLHFVYRDISK